MTTIDTFEPQTATHFDLINAALAFTEEELSKLKENGFVISDRLTFKQFKRAYAYIYWKDLPVLITTDSILHAIHQTYDKLLQSIETQVISPIIRDMLQILVDEAYKRAESTTDDRLRAAYMDMLLYLNVPLEILSHKGQFGGVWHGEESGMVYAVQQYVNQIKAANDYNPPYGEPSVPVYPTPASIEEWNAEIEKQKQQLESMKHEAKEQTRIDNERRKKEGKKGRSRFFNNGILKLTTPFDDEALGTKLVDLFGLERKIDFTLFRPRGHYDRSPDLGRYFGVMMWLALADFRFIEYTPDGEPVVHNEQIGGAYVLRELLDATGQRNNWRKLDRMMEAFVGWCDNVTLNGLDAFIEDADVNSYDDALNLDEETVLKLFAVNDYGQQRISGSIRKAMSDNKVDPLPPESSFAFFGQRFTIESWIMTNVIFDQLVVDGKKVERAFPSPLDVMYVLGNDRALAHLEDELNKYGYEGNLDDLRAQVASYSDEFWEHSFYNLWLRAIRSLNIEPESDHKPQAMQSDAWKDKMLHTQLGSWTQLRHDHILYVKPPFAPSCICEYPAGYVEPYPAFYEAVSDFARYGKALFDEVLPTVQLDMTYDDAKAHVEGKDFNKQREFMRPYNLEAFKDKVKGYFTHLDSTAQRLKALSEKELQGETFDQDDELFLRSVVVRKFVGEPQYGGYTEEHWDGWYNELLPFNDDTPQVISDIHTNRSEQLGPVGVLHVATGLPVVEVMMAHGGMYVGPAFTYYEHFERGNKRLKDSEWQALQRPPNDNSLIFAERGLHNFEQEIQIMSELVGLVGDEFSEKLEEVIKRLEAENIRRNADFMYRNLTSEQLSVKMEKLKADKQKATGRLKVAEQKYEADLVRQRPTGPAWAQSFRVKAPPQPSPLYLPPAGEE